MVPRFDTPPHHPEGIPGDSSTCPHHPERIPDDLPAFLRFAPAPVKARRDRWGAGGGGVRGRLGRGDGLRRRGAGGGAPASAAAPETLLVPRYYPGRLVGFVQREE